MDVVETSIRGLLIVEPNLFGDARGFFMELYQAERYATSGIAQLFVQDNLSRSSRGVLRGLHIQNPRPQGKLVTVLHGAVLDVVVDVRVGSPTFGKHVAVEINDKVRRILQLRRRDGTEMERPSARHRLGRQRAEGLDPRCGGLHLGATRRTTSEVW